MKITLFHPPQATLFNPYLAGPALTAALRQAGHQVRQVDLNLQTNLVMLSPAYLEALSSWGGAESSRSVGQALSDLRSNQTYGDLDWIRACYRTLDKAYAAISREYAPSRISYDLQMRYNPFAIRDLHDAIRDETENPYIELFEQTVIPQLQGDPPQLVGIGFAFDSQLIPGLTLARLIRRAMPKVHICVGGNIVTKVHKKLLAHQYLFECVDSAVIYEGETALCALAEAVRCDRVQLDQVPNLLWRKGDQVVLNDLTHWEDMTTLPTPDYEGLRLDDYLLPIRLLPTLTSRGCYWAKCAFCTHCHGFGRFRQRPVEQLAVDLDTLLDEHGSQTVFLADEAVPPRQIAALADYAEQRGKGIQWFGDVRFEKVMTRPEFLEKMVRSGCRLLAFGLESASERVLKLMDKGGTPDLYAAVLDACHEAGIFNVVMFFSGFPGETLPEAHATYQFIQKHRDVIDGWGNGAFSLQGGSDVFLNPEKYGITSIREREGAELSEVYDYTVARGISMSSAAQIADAIGHNRLRDPKYAGALPREISFAHLVLHEPPTQ